jgi:hypothetical protein
MRLTDMDRFILGEGYLTAGRNTASSGFSSNGFKWVTTGQVITYTNWSPSQPNRLSHQIYIVVINHDDTWVWFDEPNTGFPFVCEY